MKSVAQFRIPSYRRRGGIQIRHGERGIILVVTLIALVVMLISSIALIRSTDTTLGLSGNLAFRRDLVNESERGFHTVYELFYSGPLIGATTRLTNSAANNYSACVLPTESHGIPTILLDDANFANSTDSNPGTADANCHGAVASTINDITDSTQGITVRYVIDRISATTGTATQTNSVVSAVFVDTSMDNGEAKVGTVTPVYRISMRVEGPRNTLTFVQSTLTMQ